jgi:hypothetical protein
VASCLTLSVLRLFHSVLLFSYFFSLFLSLPSKTFLAILLGRYHSVNGIIIKINLKNSLFVFNCLAFKHTCTGTQRGKEVCFIPAEGLRLTASRLAGI